ncbi:MAG: carboxymuconolactone decarboxylase family protein [Alphaproteobacteria bacterium]
MAKGDYNETESFKRGLATRKAVLGDKHVEASLSKAAESPFLKLMQQVTTEYAWGDVWSRPGLDRKTRSFLSVALLACLGRSSELKVHVLGALNNGATPDEIAEVLLHTSVYAGFPAGLEGFREAHAVLKDQGKA